MSILQCDELEYDFGQTVNLNYKKNQKLSIEQDNYGRESDLNLLTERDNYFQDDLEKQNRKGRFTIFSEAGCMINESEKNIMQSFIESGHVKDLNGKDETKGSQSNSIGNE